MPYANEDSVKRIFQRCKGYTDDVAVQTIVNTQNSILNAVRAEPLDLTVAFADEIKGFSDEWAWIHNRIQNANWDGLMAGDYIPMSMTHSGSTYSFDMQIAGLDPYYGKGSSEITYHHIDFISRETCNWTIQWNTSNNNNGTADQASPWLASNAYSYLNNTMYPELPSAVRNVVIEKYHLYETRYSSSGTLTDANGSSWGNIGYLWLPTEYEITGSATFCSQNYGVYGYQYPLFALTSEYRLKRRTGTTTRAGWWTLSPGGGYSTGVVNVSSPGGITNNSASNSYCAPICFRVS